jgi:DNA polymerase III subunit delta'
MPAVMKKLLPPRFGDACKMTDSEILPSRANPDLIGHTAAEATMRAAFESDRLAHAWLISGPQGVGKATLAFRFARFVLAGGAAQNSLLGGDGGDGLWLDPQDPVFHRVASGGHADLVTLERGLDAKGKQRGEIVVQDARRLGDFLALTAGEGGWRVAVVDAADELNRNAANALLKLVEEPPRRSLLLLVCHVPGRVGATLRSRCRRLSLGPLEDAKVADLLRGWHPDLDAADIAGLAHLAEGSPGRALALAEAGGMALYRELVGLIASAPGIDAQALHSFGDKLARRGAEAAFAQAMALLGGWLARLVGSAARGVPFAELVPGEAKTAQRLLTVRDLDQWLELWEKVGDLAARAGRVNLDRKQIVLGVFAALERNARA